EDIAKGTYPRKYNEFVRRVKEKYSAADAQKILDNYESLFFIDYSHSSQKLLDMLAGDEFVGLGLSAMYNKKTFSNFKSARAWLATEKPPISKDTLTEIHQRMMKGGVEKVSIEELGKIRNGEWYGNVPEGYEIDAVTRRNIIDNPYLTWIEGTSKKGLYTGEIHYPNVALIRKEGLDIIRKSHPKIVKKVEEYQGLKLKIEQASSKYQSATEQWRRGPLGKKLKEQIEQLSKRQTELEKLRLDMNEELVNALVDQQVSWFNQQRKAIGTIDDPESLDKFTELVADFQRNLVSIHPLSNGNGRSTRELMYYMFAREGLPPPRILDPNADIYKTAAEWRLMVKQGVLSSDQLVEDLVERLTYGLPIEHSMQLLTPYTRPPYEMILKGVKNKNMMEGLEYVDPRIYREIAYREMLADSKLVELMVSDPTKGWDVINSKVKEVFEKNNLYYNHPKQGIERLELSFVDEDFLVHYGRASFNDPALYAFKMRNWYSDQIVWRGLASKTQYANEKEIVSMFKQLHPHMASNSVLANITALSSAETIRKAALADFAKFNDDVFGDGLVRMARDHSETGPLYGESYGYSTSKNREVGKAFAMGAMVVGEYGAHKAPELQALLKSRILVGAQRANKDVDLGRLKQLREEFSYKYPRQQEVMGIGASDPDAIRIIQTIAADGSVELTYLRNPKKPNEIWVIEGDIDPNAVPKKEQIKKVIKL
ncbi:MAG: Fic family protein, partial [Proteobacteria bacterium]|nr:Fic family protein [Pseudomonadota bacterium]